MAKKAARVTVPGSSRKSLPGGRNLGTTNKEDMVEVSVRLRPKQDPKALEAEIMAQGARLPSERDYLSHDDFEERFGADPEDVAKIDAFAHAHGATVRSVNLASRTVKIEGTVGALSAAFGTKLTNVKKGAAVYRVRKGPVRIPDDLQDIIVGVHGLDNRPVAKPHFRSAPRRKGKGGAASAHNAADGSLSVAEICKLYAFPGDLTGKGQCIGIIELNDVKKGKVVGTGYQLSDLKSFFKLAKIPQPDVVALGVDGGRNIPGKSDADGEVVLDIEIAGAVAPGAKIAVYFAPNTTKGFIDAIKAAVHDTTRRPSVISISWGGAEDPDGEVAQQFLDGMHEAMRSAAAMGITVCVASGDDGSADMADGWDGKPHADFPASSPFALACGGTKLTSAGGKIASEVVWNEGRSAGAGGGGVSNVFPLPTYQGASNVPKSPTGFKGRGVPDVSGNADPRTGYQIFLDGKRTSIGGTSAVAPLMAGLLALINERLTQKFGKTAGFINPLLYAQGATTLRDIIDGDNDIEGNLSGIYQAGPGWDACSGLGVADGSKLMKLLGG